MKALVVRLSSIGDVVHTLPALAALRRHGWEAGWLVEPPARVLLERQPSPRRPRGGAAARRPFAWSRRLDHPARSCGAGATTWRSTSRGSGSRRPGRGSPARAAWSAGSRRARREPGSAALLRETVARTRPRPRHRQEPGAAARRSASRRSARASSRCRTRAASVARVDDALSALAGRGFAVLNPGGGWASKLWPAERFGELARGLQALGLRSLVSYGPGEEALADRVVAASAGAAVRSFPTSLLDYVELARRARLVVAADTGPLHLACAVGTPVVALFGPTDPARNGPVRAARTRWCAARRRARRATAAPALRHAGIMGEIGAAEVLEAVDAAARRRAAAGDACRLGTASRPAGSSASLRARCWRVPRPARWLLGLPLLLAGEASACGPPGHIEKTKCLATGGPYAHSRNPLYVGSLLIALGVAVACASPWVVLAVAVYFAAFYPSVMREEAAFLARKFPREYAEWAAGVPLFWPRLSPGGRAARASSGRACA